LKEQGIETRVILSGDNEAAVRDVAGDVGADEWRAELLPQDKLDAVRALSLQYDRVAMVGDGINDAPALALADIGVAMGVAGTDAAIEAADVALMSDDLQKLPQAITIARHARAVIMQNVAIALAMKAIFVAGLFLNMWGEYQLIGGVIADTGATLLVTANALRLLRG
jgi:Cd2+/Zn2+-exporting ATPase